MRIAIIGAGAMGSLFGGLLADKADVCLYNRNQGHVKAIQEKGLLMTQGEKRRFVPVRATHVPEEIGIVDVAIVFTKYPYTRAAMEAAMHCIDKDTLVLTLQNGIGNVDIIKEFVPEEQIAFGLTAQTSDLHGPGHIEMTTHESVGTYFWPYNDIVTDRMRELETLMNEVGLETSVTPEVKVKIWRKLMVNASENTLCAILRINVGQLVSTEESFEIVKQIIFEVSDVATAKGIPISREEGVRYVLGVSNSVFNHLPSMAIDVRNHRMTEIACLNEAIVAEGKKVGVPTPTIELVARLIRTIEKNYENLAF